MNKRSLCTGLLAGLAAGAATALLNAPISGRETRGKMKDAQVSAKLTALEVKDNAGQVKESIKRLVDTAKQDVPEVINNVKVNAALWKESIEPNKQALQSEIAGIQKTVEDLQESLPQPTPKK
jgi:gas vesicle protein